MGLYKTRIVFIIYFQLDKLNENLIKKCFMQEIHIIWHLSAVKFWSWYSPEIPVMNHITIKIRKDEKKIIKCIS